MNKPNFYKYKCVNGNNNLKNIFMEPPWEGNIEFSSMAPIILESELFGRKNSFIHLFIRTYTSVKG